MKYAQQPQQVLIGLEKIRKFGLVCEFLMKLMQVMKKKNMQMLQKLKIWIKCIKH